MDQYDLNQVSDEGMRQQFSLFLNRARQAAASACTHYGPPGASKRLRKQPLARMSVRTSLYVDSSCVGIEIAR